MITKNTETIVAVLKRYPDAYCVPERFQKRALIIANKNQLCIGSGSTSEEAWENAKSRLPPPPKLPNPFWIELENHKLQVMVTPVTHNNIRVTFFSYNLNTQLHSLPEIKSFGDASVLIKAFAQSWSKKSDKGK